MSAKGYWTEINGLYYWVYLMPPLKNIGTGKMIKEENKSTDVGDNVEWYRNGFRFYMEVLKENGAYYVPAIKDFTQPTSLIERVVRRLSEKTTKTTFRHC